jgi:anhydro-N-acetylmuramic acid kinase
MNNLFIGLMSGTSVDGIDAALVDFSTQQPKLIASLYTAFSPILRKQILALCQPGPDEINRLGDLDVMLGNAFADSVNTLLRNQNIPQKNIRAIGSHGQTIRHHPNKQFTLQVGDPNIIAAKTGITTIADFRRRDIAHGGQGAPLVPAFHQYIFRNKKVNRAVVNIGGIANVTLLPANEEFILGFDTGPGNMLLDAWAEIHLQQSCDDKGSWAAKGKINNALLKKLLEDNYFKMSAPKSTGHEYFNLTWLQSYLPHFIEPADVQATLTFLTARTIMDAINQHLPESEIIVCGGGVHNDHLMGNLRELTRSVDSSEKHGVPPDWMEAVAFAWLAKQTLENKTGNIAAVTGAKQASILGGIYPV